MREIRDLIKGCFDATYTIDYYCVCVCVCLCGGRCEGVGRE